MLIDVFFIYVILNENRWWNYLIFEIYYLFFDCYAIIILSIFWKYQSNT